MKEFFNPINISEVIGHFDLDERQWGNCIEAYDFNFIDIKKIDIAVIGIEEDRGSIRNIGSKLAPKKIRQELYQLFNWETSFKVADLGNLRLGLSKEETYERLSKVLHELNKEKVLTIILGGSNDLLYAVCKGLTHLKEGINLVNIDETFDVYTSKKKDQIEQINAKNFLGYIFNDKSIHLYNYSHVGYQSYLTDPTVLSLIEKNYFEAYRLGNVRENLSEIEPIIRDADVVGIDISAVRQSDAPGNKNASPNGFFAEEACQIMRYAGMSNQLNTIGFFEYNPDFDKNNQTAKLMAQMIWYYVRGYYNRKSGGPTIDPQNFVKYIVNIKDSELVFWKHKSNERWWLEMPTKSERHKFIACSYSDYQIACNDEFPDRWLMALHKP